MSTTSYYRMKAIFMMFLCATAGIILLFALYVSRAQYLSEVKGTAQMEPALFNTVLLGDLPFEATEISASNGHSGKLTTSIEVTESHLFGAVKGTNSNGIANLQSEERRLRPGSIIAIPLTITNGTTLPGTPGFAANMAETDIAYSLNVITTLNLPLVFDIYEYYSLEQQDALKEINSETFNYEEYTKIISESNGTPSDWGTKLNMEQIAISERDDIGYSVTYAVDPNTGTSPVTTIDSKQMFSLEQQKGVISVNRYMLVIYWPDVATTIREKNFSTEELRSTRYMKEIEIVEARLEVESWVTNKTTETSITSAGSTVILRLTPDENKNAVNITEDGVYEIPTVNGSNCYAVSTVPFYATRKVSGSDGEPDYWNLSIEANNTSSYSQYTFDTKSQQYLQSKGEYVNLSDGKLAIAVPMDMMKDSTYNYTKDFTYEITYGGKTYIGTPANAYITTDVYGRAEEDEEGQTNTNYGFTTTTSNAYQLITFENSEDNQELIFNDMTSASARSAKFQLKIKQSTDTSITEDVSFDNYTDDFRILIYGGSGSAAEEGGSSESDSNVTPQNGQPENQDPTGE